MEGQGDAQAPDRAAEAWLKVRSLSGDDFLSPATACTISSGAALAMRLPFRSTDSVRTWLILSQGFFGKPFDSSSSVSGKPARCAWPVMAMAMTVPERSLKIS